MPNRIQFPASLHRRLRTLAFVVAWILTLTLGFALGAGGGSPRAAEAAEAIPAQALLDHYREIRWLEGERNEILRGIGRDLERWRECGCRP